jgi:hypothetical protein
MYRMFTVFVHLAICSCLVYTYALTLFSLFSYEDNNHKICSDNFTVHFETNFVLLDTVVVPLAYDLERLLVQSEREDKRVPLIPF